jgi:hypothetical protein
MTDDQRWSLLSDDEAHAEVLQMVDGTPLSDLPWEAMDGLSGPLSEALPQGRGRRRGAARGRRHTAQGAGGGAAGRAFPRLLRHRWLGLRRPRGEDGRVAGIGAESLASTASTTPFPPFERLYHPEEMELGSSKLSAGAMERALGRVEVHATALVRTWKGQ